jgi:NADH-quinone oxidoreductase subunit K
VTDIGTACLVLAGVLFSIGTLGVITRRGAITILMSIELMLNASNLALITVTRFLPLPGGATVGVVDGQVIGFFVLAIAAAEVVVGLAIVIALFRLKGSVDIDLARILRW